MIGHFHIMKNSCHKKTHQKLMGLTISCEALND